MPPCVSPLPVNTAADPQASEPRAPRVSVCIPAYQAQDLIRAAVVSALRQTDDDLEVVVVDNASSDATVDRLRGIDDPRLRVFRNTRNIGAFRNFNRAIALSRGRYIKLLCADDVLAPDCVGTMAAIFESDVRVGLCFCPREIELEDPAEASSARWKEKHEAAHAQFGPLAEVNEGSALLDAWIRSGLRDNWVGEPTSVMVSRRCLERTGTFPLRLHDRGDMDLWARAMLAHRVGFAERPLVRYLVRSGSLAADNRRTGRPWLDSLWMLEGLIGFEEASPWRPALRSLRRRALGRSLRNGVQGKRAPDSGKLRALGEYLSHRIGGRGRRSLYGDIADTGARGETAPVAAQRESTART